MKRRLIALILVLAMTLSSTGMTNVARAEENGDVKMSTEQIAVEGTDSFGTMLSSEIDEKLENQQTSQGCHVFSIEVEGNQALVTFETTESAALVVGIYSEDGKQMIASGKTDVEAGEKEAIVSIDTASMPEYFLVRGFLVNQESFRPISESYETEKYTQEMSEFLEKTAADFPKERVLLLDEYGEENYAVFGDEVAILASETKTATPTACNIVTEVDEEEKRYAIEDIDEEVAGLQEGDIFSCTYGEDETLIVKVGSIEIDGKTAVIMGQDAAMDETFEYVNISGEAQLDEEGIDPSTCSEGVEYVGMEDYVPEGAAVYSRSARVSYSKQFSHNLVNQKIGSGSNSASVNGSIAIHLTTSFEYIKTGEKKHVELKFTYNGTMKLTIKGSCAGSFSMTMVPYTMAGITIRVTPKIHMSANAKFEATGTVSGVVGFACYADGGMQNLTTKPELKVKLDGEYTLYIGLEITPEIVLGCDWLAVLSMTAKVGGEVTGRWTNVTTETAENEKHDCKSCIDGEIYWLYSLDFKARFLDSDALTYECKVADEKVKWKDYYWSHDTGESGLTVCPYYQYLVTVTVQDGNGNPVEGATVNSNYTTGSNGKAQAWMSSGMQTITAHKNGYSAAKNMEIIEPKSVVVSIGGSEGTGSQDTDGSGDGFDSSNAGKVEQIAVGREHVLALMKDGSAYAWGENNSGRFGDGTTVSSTIPVKITNNASSTMLHENMVEEIACSRSSGEEFGFSAAITKDGGLYTWGSDVYEQLGNGSANSRKIIPTKIMDNVVSVSLGSHSGAAITKDGSLYTWGGNWNGQLGDGTREDKSIPVKIMDNVVSVSLGESCSAAIKKDGSLYTWGNNPYGELGNGTENNCYTRPTKIMNNVSMVDMSYNGGAAITEDGNLYMWGNNNYGWFGNGDGSDSLIPILVAGNISKVSIGDSHSGILTKDGDLYMAGANGSGQLGAGTTSYCTSFKKILSGVADIKLEYGYSIAIMKDGTIYTWGRNNYGQLGNGTTTNCYFPTPITIPYQPVALSSLCEDSSSSVAAASAALAISHEQEETEAVSAVSEELQVEEEAVSAVAVASATTTTARTVKFTGLFPEETYNFYSMKYKGSKDACGSDNLLYIRQLQADEEGNISVTYYPDEEYSTPTEFVVQMKQTALSELDIQIPEMSYNGKKQYIEPVIKDGDTLLEQGKDYEISGEYVGKESGEYTLMITGKDGYVGSITKTYSIDKVDCKVLTVGEINTEKYNTGKICPKVQVTYEDNELEQGTDYEVEYQNNSNVGYGIVIIKGKGNYIGKQICLFDIEPCELSEVTAGEIDAQEYTGSELTPDVALSYQGEALEQGQDYILAYENNVKEGIASITVTGTGNFTGTLMQTFQIIPKTASPAVTSSAEPVNTPEVTNTPSIESTETPESSPSVQPPASSPTEPGTVESLKPQESTQPSATAIPEETAKSQKEKNIKEGMSITDSKTKTIYIVTFVVEGKNTVTYQKPKKKSVKKVNIPATITVEGVTYQVTGIANNALKGCKKLRSVVIGKNVKKIGKKAFYGCKDLRRITIKTTKLTQKTIGNKAFQGIHSKAVIQVPKKKASLYQKILRKKGFKS